MKISKLLMTAAVVVMFAGPAMAQTATPSDTPVSVKGQPRSAGEETQRDVNQQDRIENGLKDGQLTTGEAARLENGEAHVDSVEAKDMKDGTLSAKDKAQIQAMQNKESHRIYDQKHDAQTGNPNSASDKRMQADVQRNINQENRIENGVKSGQLTKREDAKLQGGEAHDDRRLARAGANGHIGKGEQRRIQAGDNRESRRVYWKKHNRVKKPT